MKLLWCSLCGGSIPTADDALPIDGDFECDECIVAKNRGEASRPECDACGISILGEEKGLVRPVDGRLLCQTCAAPHVAEWDSADDAQESLPQRQLFVLEDELDETERPDSSWRTDIGAVALSFANPIRAIQDIPQSLDARQQVVVAAALFGLYLIVSMYCIHFVVIELIGTLGTLLDGVGGEFGGHKTAPNSESLDLRWLAYGFLSLVVPAVILGCLAHLLDRMVNQGADICRTFFCVAVTTIPVTSVSFAFVVLKLVGSDPARAPMIYAALPVLVFAWTSVLCFQIAREHWNVSERVAFVTSPILLLFLAYFDGWLLYHLMRK